MVLTALIQLRCAGNNLHFHQNEKQLHTLTSVEQRSIWTLWCSYSPNCSHALQTTTTLIHQKCMHFILLAAQSEELWSCLLSCKHTTSYDTHSSCRKQICASIKVKNNYTHGTSWAEDGIGIVVSLWSCLFSCITTNYRTRSSWQNICSSVKVKNNYTWQQLALVEQWSITYIVWPQFAHMPTTTPTHCQPYSSKQRTITHMAPDGSILYPVV